MSSIEQVKIMIDPLGRVDRKNAAKALGRKPKTLADWHSRGLGPKGFKVQGRVFYLWSDIEAFARGNVA